MLPNFFNVEKAHLTQRMLAKKVLKLDSFLKPIASIAGADVAFNKGKALGAVAVLQYPSLKTIESSTAVQEVGFPYIPTLLSFREMPVLYKAISNLREKPTITLIDGQGQAHPYRCGIASHLGVVMNIPTIGVAKKRLWGDVGEFKEGRWALITDAGEVIGAAVITKEGSKPIYVSIGNKVSLKTAIDIVLKVTLPNERLPKPLIEAHKLAHSIKKHM